MRQGRIVMTTRKTALPESRAQLLAGIIAASAFAALAVQVVIGSGSLLENAGGLVRFFTIWSNIAACAIMAWIASGRSVSRAVMAALVTALTVVGLVYWGLLSGEHHPVGIDRITNQFHHTIIPLASVLWWLRYTPPSPEIMPLLPVIMVPPLSYGAFAFVLGELTGFYAYFFVDLPSLGWPMFLLNNAVLALFFAALGAGLVAIKNRIGARSLPQSQTL